MKLLAWILTLTCKIGCLICDGSLAHFNECVWPWCDLFSTNANIQTNVNSFVTQANSGIAGNSIYDRIKKHVENYLQ